MIEIEELVELESQCRSAPETVVSDVDRLGVELSSLPSATSDVTELVKLQQISFILSEVATVEPLRCVVLIEELCPYAMDFEPSDGESATYAEFYDTITRNATLALVRILRGSPAPATAWNAKRPLDEFVAHTLTPEQSPIGTHELAALARSHPQLFVTHLRRIATQITNTYTPDPYLISILVNVCKEIPHEVVPVFSTHGNAFVSLLEDGDEMVAMLVIALLDRLAANHAAVVIPYLDEALPVMLERGPNVQSHGAAFMRRVAASHPEEIIAQSDALFDLLVPGNSHRVQTCAALALAEAAPAAPAALVGRIDDIVRLLDPDPDPDDMEQPAIELIQSSGHRYPREYLLLETVRIIAEDTPAAICDHLDAIVPFVDSVDQVEEQAIRAIGEAAKACAEAVALHFHTIVEKIADPDRPGVMAAYVFSNLSQTQADAIIDHVPAVTATLSAADTTKRIAILTGIFNLVNNEPGIMGRLDVDTLRPVLDDDDERVVEIGVKTIATYLTDPAVESHQYRDLLAELASRSTGTHFQLAPQRRLEIVHELVTTQAPVTPGSETS